NLAELILNFAALSPDAQLQLLETSRQMVGISSEDDA
ncbi:XRE family transcriptional regulator, partial [Salmonella enterica subsp. enterica serovar Enteritidis]|nr:XRE family transcriptional regulator [Salmonella enterica subsp. enterica serovar Enteritidis]